MKRLVVLVLLCAAFAQFGARAVRHRNEIQLWDFAALYSASRSWLHAADPYDQASVRDTWVAAGGHAGANIEFWSSVYPPTTLTMLAPVALLPARAAMSLWLALTLGLLALQFAALLDLAGLKLSWRDPRGLLLIAGSLASAPLQFGVLSGQPSTPAIALCIIVIWCITRNREVLGGVLLGLTFAWKPHVAAPFILYYLVLRRWRAVEPALIVVALLAAVSLAAMQLTHVNWMHGWAHNVDRTLAVGGVNDRAPTGPFRDEIIDLQVLLAALLTRGHLVALAAACVMAVLIAWYVRTYPAGLRAAPSLVPGSKLPASSDPLTFAPVQSASEVVLVPARPRAPSPELLPLAALAALSLLAVYHRVYDAVILTLAFAWALAALHSARRGTAMVAIGLLCVFLIPFDILSSITSRVRSLSQMSDTWWWAALVEPHYAWGLLTLTLSLLWAMSQRCTSAMLANSPADESGWLARARFALPRNGRDIDHGASNGASNGGSPGVPLFNFPGWAVANSTSMKPSPNHPLQPRSASRGAIPGDNRRSKGG